MKVRVSLNVELCDFSNVMNAGSTFKDALFLKEKMHCLINICIYPIFGTIFDPKNKGSVSLNQ